MPGSLGWKRVALVALCAFGAGMPQASARTVSFDMRSTTEGQTTTAKVTLNDGNFRMEAVQEGTLTVVIRNRQGIFTFLPAEHVAMRLPALETSSGVIDDINDFVGYVNKHNGKVVREETVAGKLCDVYEFVDPGNGNATTAWVWKEREFPLRIITDGPDGRITAEFSNIHFDVPVNASMFRIPKDFEILDANAGPEAAHHMGGDLGDLEF